MYWPPVRILLRKFSIKMTEIEYRKTILDIIYNGGAGHTSGSLSCIDILNVLYTVPMGVSWQE